MLLKKLTTQMLKEAQKMIHFDEFLKNSQH